MLKLSLAAVDRDEVRIQEQVPPDDPMFEGTGVEFATPLDVDLSARSVGEDSIFVRGTLRTTVRQPCRRCLSPVELKIDETVDFLFADASEEGDDVDGEVYTIPARGGDELDLTDAVREQVLLNVPQFALCGEECRGLCPTCGANLNEGACECVPEAAPSPWDALKKIKLD
jgi:uncharacterized protein